MRAPATGFLVPWGQGLQAERWAAPVTGLMVPAGLQSSSNSCSSKARWHMAHLPAFKTPLELRSVSRFAHHVLARPLGPPPHNR